jgi:hypothetical protein
MLLNFPHLRRTSLLFFAIASALLPRMAAAASCKTQSQMTAAERDALASAARSMVAEVQRGDVPGLQANTIPEVAANFGGIANSVNSLKPMVQQATITVDSLYAMDASTEAPGSAQTDFYCGTPVVVLNFSDLPPGIYALAILHATGIPQPQQMSFVLVQGADRRWKLGGFYSKPMMEAGHDGLWYWVAARKYAEKKMNWDAWLYYRMAADFLDPVNFLSSPNLEKLQHEEDQVRPAILPGAQQPLTLNFHGSAFQVTAIDTTTTFGPLDIEVHYNPDANQAAQLRDPPTARKQVTDLMTALLEQHPDLPNAFHGIWVQADAGSASLFSLELPMNQIIPGTPVTGANSNRAVQ